MFLINANVLDDKFCLRKADIEIEDGKIVRLEDSLPYKEEDLVVDRSEEHTSELQSPSGSRMPSSA